MRSRTLHTLIATVAAVAVIAAAALVPRFVFKAQDKALLAGPHTYPGATGKLDYTVPAMDIPVVRALYSAEETDYTDPVWLAEQDRSVVPELLPRVEEYLYQLMDAGALPPELVDYLLAEIIPRDTLNFSHSVDSWGFETITCNSGMGTNPPYYFSIKVDMSTDKVLGVESHLPENAPVFLLPSADYMEGFLAYLGLADAGDWMGFPGQGGHIAEDTFAMDIARSYSGRMRLEATVSQYVNAGANFFGFGIVSWRTKDEDWWQNYTIQDGAIAVGEVAGEAAPPAESVTSQ